MAFEDSCKNTVGPNHPDPTNTGVNTNPGCSPSAIEGSSACPTTVNDLTCEPFQLSELEDSCVIEGYVNEALNIGGARLNVYKLLGIHEQCKIIDSTGQGTPLSSGYLPGFPSDNAFDAYISEWHSVQKGNGVIASAYIGYDFGPIKTNDNSREMYGIETNIRKNISAIAIKQSANTNNRVTRVRIERSDNGTKWYGVSIINLPDDDCLNTILFKDSVPNRYWRIRPISFNGENNDFWSVQALQMFHNYIATDVTNIQDKILLENRDRDYADEPIVLKGSYDLTDLQSELSAVGIEINSDIKMVTVSFASCVALLGRPLIIGDIIEIPSEAQYSAKMRKILKWMEVTDVTWASEGYTPGWKPTLLKVTLQPALATQETQDLFGDLAESENDLEGLVYTDGIGENPYYQDYSDVSQTIQADAKDKVPEDGRESSGTVRQWESEDLETANKEGIPLQITGQNPTGLYTEDAMPPNNAPFTEGSEYPESPTHGDYHRLTYENLSKNVPARLYRYSSSKGRWIFLEKDRRAEFNGNKPRLQEFLTATNKKGLSETLKYEPQQCEAE